MFQRIQPIFYIVILMWFVQVLNFVTGYSLSKFGIIPRQLVGIWGVLFSPFLHNGFFHLLCNTFPFLVLASLIAAKNLTEWIKVSLFIMVFTGGSVWLFGRYASHIGASGMIFGYFGYLIGKSFYQPSVLSITIGLFTIFIYGGLIWGILPTGPHISWEGHLFGFLIGILAAKLKIGSL